MTRAELRLVGTALAGAAWRQLGAGDAVKIMTGAMMPAGLDTVVPQELCQVEGEQCVSREHAAPRRQPRASLAKT
jgi:molybdopterin molybdotransferase